MMLAVPMINHFVTAELGRAVAVLILLAALLRAAVIVLDFALPDLNAAQVVERLMAPGRATDAQVLIVTAGVSAGDMA